MRTSLQSIKNSLSKEVWLFLALIAMSLGFLLKFVNLQPQVDEAFFFSSSDPKFQNERLISRLFVRKDAQIIISAKGSITNPVYEERVAGLTSNLLRLDGITGVKSVTHGPDGVKDALASPLWKRLLISDDQASTNLIVLLRDDGTGRLIPPIENLVGKYNREDFELRISGLPYVVEQIRRSLLRDLRVFSVLAVIIFGIVIAMIFRSRMITAGTLLSCFGACIWTLMINALLDVPIGLMTANLTTIIFVLTLSHLVFLTFNWRNGTASGTADDAVRAAVRHTLPASFWSMLTTLLGFISLLWVPAKPLRDLGTAGSAGTLIAFAVAYTIYPAFLRLAHRSTESVKTAGLSGHTVPWIFRIIDRQRRYISAGLIILAALAAPGLRMLNTDPSLLAYFDDNSEIARGLHYIDRNGGSSPLLIVVRSDSGATLNTQSAYQGLWQLQRVLEEHRAVGSIISLPVLMAEAKRSPITFFMAWEWLLNIMEKPQYDAVAKSFITADRKFGLFLLRMNESQRSISRVAVVEELEGIVRSQGFIPEITGGVYRLQGHLSQLVASSLVFGLGRLMLLFAVIAWVASRSFKIGVAMTVSIGIIPIIVLGLTGLYRIPLDIIAAPASNVAIALGIDAMIHMVNSFRRRDDDGQPSWDEVRAKLWPPVVTAMLVIGLGFGIFLFSNFPPTRRFGATVVGGTVLAALSALYLMPTLARIRRRRVKRWLE